MHTMQVEVIVEMTYAKDVNSFRIEDIQYVQYATFFPLYGLATGHFQYSMGQEERKITLTIQFRPRTPPQDYIHNIS